MAYNDSIVIQQATESRGDAGGVEDSWATYKTVWAEIEDSGSAVSGESDMPVFGDTKSFKIRTADAPSVTSKMRIAYDPDRSSNGTTEYFYIRSIQKEGRLRTILLAEAFDDE